MTLTGEALKVFISWSGPASRELAEALHGWLPSVIQGLDPFISAKDIDKGTTWVQELTRELEETQFGVVALAPDNTQSPWLHYEVGALTRSVTTRVCPVLLGLDKADVEAPLAQLQLTSLDKEDMRLMMSSINKQMGPAALANDKLEASFEIWWPRLMEKADAISVSRAPKSSVALEPSKPTASVEELLEETLTIVRRLERRESQRRVASRSSAVKISNDSLLPIFIRDVLQQLDFKFEEVATFDNSLHFLCFSNLDLLPNVLVESWAKLAKRDGLAVDISDVDRRFVMISRDGAITRGTSPPHPTRGTNN